jgi:Tfp pilus assembly protein PilF
MDEYVLALRTDFKDDFSTLSEACQDDSVITKPRAALNCGMIALINGDFDRAGSLLLRASKSLPADQCATALAAVLVLKNRSGLNDWVETRSVMRSLLRSGSPRAKQILDIDGALND